MNRIQYNNHSAMRLMIAAVICMTGLGRALAVQGLSVSAVASESSVQVAQPFTVEFTVKANVGTRVVFPSIGDRLGEFDVVDTQDLFDVPDQTAGDLRTWTRRLTLESIVTGELNIPAIEIHITGNSGPEVIRSKPIPIRIVSILEDRSDPTKFRDIQSVVDVAVPEVRSRLLAWCAWGGVSGLAFALAAGAFLRRRKQWLTPKQWALQELDQLDETVETGSASTEAVAVELSMIVRDFLQLQFALGESGQTTQELIEVIESRDDVGSELIHNLDALFSLADKAKFAGVEVSPAGLKNAVADARAIVETISSPSESRSAQGSATTTPAFDLPETK